MKGRFVEVTNSMIRGDKDQIFCKLGVNSLRNYKTLCISI